MGSRARAFWAGTQSRASPTSSPKYILNQLKAFVTKNWETTSPSRCIGCTMPPQNWEGALAAHFNKPDPSSRRCEQGSRKRVRKSSKGAIPITISLLVSARSWSAGAGCREKPEPRRIALPHVVNELRNWRTKRDQRYETETATTMAPIAASLSKAETEAVAAYVNSIWLRHGRQARS